MNAEGTALRVLRWAQAPVDAESGSPHLLPAGPLSDAGRLARPSDETIAAFAELVRRTTTRLGAGSPPLGDAAPVGLGGILLAAAIGGRGEPERAKVVAEALTPPRLTGSREPWADALGRHAVASAVLEADDDECGGGPPGTAAALTELLLETSPLTAVLHRPPLSRLASRATAGDVAAALSLAARPAGPTVLRGSLCRWCPDAAVLGWRAELLSRLAAGNEDLVIETYIAARLRHGEDWDRRIEQAARTLGRIGIPDELAIETIRYWQPLDVVRRRHSDLTRAHPILRDCMRALRLVQRHRFTISIAA